MNIFQSIHRFIREYRQYNDYMKVYVSALGKAEVSNTALGYLWWFLDPILYMVIYIIMVRVAFNQRQENFIVFFFSAMLIWRYFSVYTMRACGSIYNNLKLCREIYIPKFIFPLASCVSGLNPLYASLGFLVIIIMPLTGTPFTINLLYLPLLIFLTLLTTWILGLIFAQINIIMNDFSNILNHIMMVGMFATPIFYDIDRIPEKAQFFIKLNPIGVLTTSFRAVILHGQAPPLKRMIFLLIFLLISGVLAIHIMYKYDKFYNKISH